jgi:hypothetical protein
MVAAIPVDHDSHPGGAPESVFQHHILEKFFCVQLIEVKPGQRTADTIKPDLNAKD